MLHQILTSRREELKMSMDELAVKSGVPKGTLSKIMCGITANPQFDSLRSIVYALEMTLADIENIDKISLDALRIARAYDMMTDKGRAAVDAVVELAISKDS